MYFGSAKPESYGLKAYPMVDARTFYTCNMEIYLGRQAGNNPIDNTPGAVVKRLIAPISGSGRNVTTDNWYTSVDLALDLKRNHRLTLVGTIRKNRREVPVEFTTARGREALSSMFAFTDDITLVSYVPKPGKVVNAISTMHNDAAIDAETGDQRKPELITFYNESKGGVDTMDQLCATYTVARRTRRWPVCVFYNLLNIAGVNAMVVHKLNHINDVTFRRKFLVALGRELCMDWLGERVDDGHLSRELRNMAAKYSGRAPPPHGPAMPEERPEAHRRTRCEFCDRARDRKTKFLCSKCHRVVCKEHQVHICPTCAAI
jgi:hypothetical protein